MDGTPSPTLRWAPVLLAWAILGLLFLPQALLLNLTRPEPWPQWLAALRSLLIFLIWALFTPLLLRAVRRWPPFSPMRWRNGLRLVGAAIALSALHLSLMAVFGAAVAAAAGAPVDPRRLLTSAAIGIGATNLLMSAAVCAVGIALLHFHARRAAEHQLAEARLAVLRHQLQPHFLFNTLNALAELVLSDPRRAESLLLRLSALLRRALADGQARRITLREELDFLDDYLAIQQALFGERLRVERDIDDDTLNARLPPMLLQPLVENGLRHGLAPRREGGTLRLRTRREPGRLWIEIADDGAGAADPAREGIGLRNTRERLRSEYGAGAGIDIDTAPGRGYRIRLELPAP